MRAEATVVTTGFVGAAGRGVFGIAQNVGQQARRRRFLRHFVSGEFQCVDDETSAAVTRFHQRGVGGQLAASTRTVPARGGSYAMPFTKSALPQRQKSSGKSPFHNRVADGIEKGLEAVVSSLGVSGTGIHSPIFFWRSTRACPPPFTHSRIALGEVATSPASMFSPTTNTSIFGCPSRRCW
jgi:hypothetical protein